MRIRNIDKDGDWCFGYGQTDYVKGQASVLLDIQMRLREWYQDCFFALLNGIPWSVRLGYHNQRQLLDADVKNVIKSTAGVLNISDFVSTVNNRKYTVTVKVYTQYTGDGQIFNYSVEI